MNWKIAKNPWGQRWAPNRGLGVSKRPAPAHLTKLFSEQSVGGLNVTL